MLHSFKKRTLRAAQTAVAKVAVFALLFSSVFSGTAAAAAGDLVKAAAGASPVKLSDISGSYAQKEIEALVKAGIISGYEDGSFLPEKPMTRAELAKILVLASGKTENAAKAAGFTDVPADSWYRGYVGALVESGVTDGTSATTFSPDANVTREQLIVFFIRALGLSQKADALPADAKLTDLQSVSAWAKSSVSLGHKIGFIQGIDNGNGTVHFAPKEFAQRQALARLAYEFIENREAFTAKAEELLKQNVTPSPSPSATPVTGGGGGSSGGGSSGGSEQTFSVLQATAVDRTTVQVTLNQNISNPAYVKEFTFNNDLQVTGKTVKTGTSTVILSTSEQTPEKVYRIHYNGVDTLVDVTGSPDILTSIDSDVSGVFKLNQADTIYGPESGNVTINGNLYLDAPGITLRNVTVKGNLIITDAVGEGEANLEGVTVNGQTIVNGGGENSIHLTRTILATLIVDKKTGMVRIVTEQNGYVRQTTLRSSTVLEQTYMSDLYGESGFGNVAISPAIPVQSYISLQGNFDTVDVNASIVVLHVNTGIIGSLNVGDPSNPSAGGSQIDLADNSTVSYLHVAAPASFTGLGMINGATLLVNSLPFETLPISYTVGEGIAPPVEVTPDYGSDIVLAGATFGNGRIALRFYGDPGPLAIADFDIEASLNGTTYATGDWTYDAVEKAILFPALPDNDEGFLTVALKASGDQFAGHLRNLVLSGFSGNIRDVDGYPVANAQIVFRKGLGNTDSSAPAAGSAVTDSSGRYSIRLGAGVYTGELIKDGFIHSFLVAVAATNTYNRNENATAVRITAPNESRIVLTWGLNPRDEDSHLIGPSVSGNTFHTWYGGKTNTVNGAVYVDLDLDDVTSFGPETTTIRQDVDGEYLFYVHHYSGSGTLRTSSAQVKVYRGESAEPLETYYIPTGSGSELYWVVFKATIQSGTISFTPVNELTNDNPLNRTNSLGNNTQLQSGSYTVNNDYLAIFKVPSGTAVETFKQNLTTIDSTASYEVYVNNTATIRTGNVEDYDTVVVTGANGIAKRTLTVRVGESAFYGTVTGSVYAQGGNPLTGVSVTAKTVTGVTYSSQTSVDGSFNISSLPAGKYTVRAEKTGYDSYVWGDVTVLGGNSVTQLQAISLDTVTAVTYLYASAAHSVTHAVYSQPVISGSNTDTNAFHLPAGARFLQIQFSQELALSQNTLQFYVNNSASYINYQVLSGNILSLDLSTLTSGQAANLKIVGLKKTSGNILFDPINVYTFLED